MAYITDIGGQHDLVAAPYCSGAVRATESPRWTSCAKKSPQYVVKHAITHRAYTFSGNPE